MLPTTLVVATAIAMLFPTATISRSNGRSSPKRQYTEAQIHNTTTSTECSAVHVIVDRATGEPPGQGVIGTLATLIALRVPDTTVEWVNYPAVLVPYDQSTTTGIEMTKARVYDYANSCPVAKIILLGYSQGAQVVGDVLCGGGGAIGLGPITEPLEDVYLQRVAAVVQMGDPRFMANQVWNAGTSKTNGLFPRTPDRSCNRVAVQMRSYCDFNDPFCAVPGIDFHVHESYNLRYNEDAFEFIANKLGHSTISN